MLIWRKMNSQWIPFSRVQIQINRAWQHAVVVDDVCVMWVVAAWLMNTHYCFVLADCECWIRCDGNHNECFVNSKRNYLFWFSLLNSIFISISISITIFNFNRFFLCLFIDSDISAYSESNQSHGNLRKSDTIEKKADAKRKCDIWISRLAYVGFEPNKQFRL